MSATAASRDGDVSPGTLPSAARARHPSSLPAEERLLLLSAGSVANDDAIRDVARGPVDWQRLLGLAQLERAVPLVYARLRAVGPELVPAELLDQMRRLALVSDFAMLHLDGRLRESLRVLAGARVRVMLLKGAALAHSAYQGFRQRPMSDLDVLVDPSNAHLARRMMLGAGWRDIVGGVPDRVYDRHHHLPPLYDARSPELQIEIHTALFPERQPFAFDASDLWARARPLGPEFPDAFVPDPMHLLLHACLHFMWSHQGRFGVWRMIRDVDALTRSGTVDWDEFVAVAAATRGATACYWTFRIAEVTAGVAVPASVVDRLRPPRSSFMLRAIERHFVMNVFPVDVTCPSVTLDHALWELAVMPRRSGHGGIRPWDEEAEFVVPRNEAGGSPAMPRRERIRRFLASPSYIRTLLRPNP
jgi:hypothetical protein